MASDSSQVESTTISSKEEDPHGIIDPQKELYNASLRHLLAPIQVYLDDESVSEVMVNGYKTIFIESGGRIKKTASRFQDEESWNAAVKNITQYVGKRLTPENLSIEARLPDGSRVHIVQSPAATVGTCVSIRKFSKEKLDMEQLIKFGSVSAECAEFLSIAVKLAKNVVVSGGTGSGKTTLLNCLSAMIPSEERIIVLEDSSELQLQQEHIVPFEVKPPDAYGRGGISMRELFKGSLRMRPDRIVVGECRGGEALDMIQAMNSGHGGSMSTAHANTPLDVLSRLEVMCLMGGVELPLSAVRAQICSAIELVIQISRFHDGRRMITHVSEVRSVDDKGLATVNDIYTFGSAAANGDAECLSWTGNSPTFAQQVLDNKDQLNIDLTSKIWQ